MENASIEYNLYYCQIIIILIQKEAVVVSGCYEKWGKRDFYFLVKH